MNPSELVEKEKKNRNIVWLVFFSAIITMVLSAISLVLYKTSGTEQLDLSRPGYNREGADEFGAIEQKEFSPKGEISGGVINEFDGLLMERFEAVESVNAFREESLSDETLGVVGN
jgi:hypothetical protein